MIQFQRHLYCGWRDLDARVSTYSVCVIGKGTNYQRHIVWRIHACQEFFGKVYIDQVDQSDGAELKYTIELSFGGKVGVHVGVTKSVEGGDSDHVDNPEP